MYEPRHYDRPPTYSAHYTAPSNVYPSRSYYSQRSEYGPSSPVPQDFYTNGTPQNFYRLLSPPGIVKSMEGLVVLLCFVIFACVASTLVWDMHGFDANISGYLSASGSFGAGVGSGYYGGSYGYQTSYMTPYSAKSAMISMAAINFIISLGFLVASFSKARGLRGRRFYLTVLVADIILSILQGIIDIIFVIGVNPMAQSSQSMLYNPILMMCQTYQGTTISGGVGTGFPGAYPMFTQYLYHYCYMDPEEAVALVCGIFVVIALAVAAYFSYKTRSKIWRHGKHNIYWEEPPLLNSSRSQDLQDWTSNLRSTHMTSTLVLSEKAAPDLRGENSVLSYPVGTVSVVSRGTYNEYRENVKRGPPEPLYRDNSDSSSIVEEIEVQSASLEQEKNRGQVEESQYETGYTTGAETSAELDIDKLEDLYPEITSDAQRHEYKRDFDLSLSEYKQLCAEMDDINDQMNKLSRELDTLEEGSMKFQAVADEYNRLKDIKQTPDYKTKKLQCKEIRQKLFHIKRLVKSYDRGYS
ncbi:occludin [Chanos chanos]|uniref:Occludin n=1 Tax=Chanos chanos TaxID=29144 RepID=A0A6J2VDF1_CHACN|nr:occludin-like [Chanos chanos]